MRNDSDKSCKENLNKYLRSNKVFKKLCLLGDKIDKYFKAGEAIDDNTARAQCMLYT